MAEPPTGVADYEFLRHLGTGDPGSFYLATTPVRLGLAADLVVVKVMSAPNDDDALRRASRELRAFATAGSPYLVTVYDAGRQDQYFFYSTEFLPLGSLRDPATTVDRNRALGVMADAARAANALHQAGLVHRGITPASILIAEDGGRLSDLGLAQTLNPGTTVTGLGSLSGVQYLDPAILLGERGTVATDIWSLGITLHYALTGQGVYGDLASTDGLVAIRRVLSSAPELNPDLDAADSAVIQACLSPVVADRPRDAGELADLIDALPRART